MTGQTATQDWRHDAECQHSDPELFFPIGTTHAADRARTEEAKAVCRRCPSREACLEWALDNRADYGIWGGLAEHERGLLKRRRQRQRRADK